MSQPQVDPNEQIYLDKLAPENRDYERNRLAQLNLSPEARSLAMIRLANLEESEITAANQRIVAARAALPPPPVPPVDIGAGAGAGNGTASSPLLPPAPVAPAKNKTFTLKVFVTPDQNTMIKVKEQLRDVVDEDPDFRTTIPLTKSRFGGIDATALSAINFAVGATGQQPVESAAPNAAAPSRFSIPGLFGSKRGGSKKKKRKSTKRRGKTARR